MCVLKLDILHPEENFNELDSEALYNSIKKVVNQTICDFRGIEFIFNLQIFGKMLFFVF